jgi:hypothetical protein
MAQFESITQYNNKFNNLFININQKGFACGFFSVLTVYNYLQNNLYDKNVHEKNIEEAIKYTAKKKIFSGVNFDNLLEMVSNLNKKNIMSTSVELIKIGILSYQHIFDNSDNLDKYAIIFLKNEKYFVVLYDKIKNKYFLRDCHESKQTSYESLEVLTKRLDEAYQFNSDIDVLGNEYIAYSSIEFIRITEKDNIKQKIMENNMMIEQKIEEQKKEFIYDDTDFFIF